MVNNNSKNNTNNNTYKGGNNMENLSIKEKLELRKAQKEEAAKAAEAAKKAEERKAYLDSLPQKDIVDRMADIRDGSVRIVRDDNDNLQGINGGKYLQVLYKGKMISASTHEELESIKKRIDNSIYGDGMLYREVIIDGLPCQCVGETIEELEADIKAAEEFAAQRRLYSMFKGDPAAEKYEEAGILEKDLEHLKKDDKYTDSLIYYPEKLAMDLDGNPQVDLDDLESDLSRTDNKNLLVQRLEAKQAAEKAECDDYDDYDDCDDCDDYDDYDDYSDWDEDYI